MTADRRDITDRRDTADRRVTADRRDTADRGDGDRRTPRTRAQDGDGPVLPSRSKDDSDVGWGDEPAERDEDWYRRERPPHHE